MSLSTAPLFYLERKKNGLEIRNGWKWVASDMEAISKAKIFGTEK